MSSAQHVWELSRAILNEKDGAVVLLKAFMDESGTHDQSPVLTVGGYIGTAKEWRSFTKEWNRQLRPVKVYHSTDCQNLRGEFEGWSPTQRDAFVIRMLKVIRDANIGGVIVGIVMRDYEEAISKYPDLQMLGRPYTTCFHWAIETVIQDLWRHNMHNRLAFIHEINDYQHEAVDAFNAIRGHYNPGNRMMSLAFGEKAEFVPLQAADIVVYECNKRLRDFKKPNRRALDAINPDEKRLRLRYLYKDNIPGVVDKIRRMQAAGELE
jgi:hypothetical protein